MASLKILFVLVALLFISVSAHPTVDYAIHSINVVSGDDVTVEDEGKSEDSISVIDDLDRALLTSERAPREKAKFAVKKVEAGYARTTNVGLTVQKGTVGIIKFRIRVKAVTVEQLALKAKLFVKALSKTQKRELRHLSKGYDGGLDIPWLKYLGINLNKKAGKKDFIKSRSKTAKKQYDRLVLLAKLLLKDSIAQTIEVKGVLKAKGISFIPTTVFSFIRIAKVHFKDGSKLLVLSDHPGDVAAATKDGGRVVPSDVESLKIL